MQRPAALGRRGNAWSSLVSAAWRSISPPPLRCRARTFISGLTHVALRLPPRSRSITGRAMRRRSTPVQKRLRAASSSVTKALRA